VPNGVEPILKMIGGLPPGTPAAFEAAFGAGWLVEPGMADGRLTVQSLWPRPPYRKGCYGRRVNRERRLA